MDGKSDSFAPLAGHPAGGSGPAVPAAVMPQYQPVSQAYSRGPTSGGDGGSWAGVMVIACLALGFTCAYCKWEMGRLAQERQHAVAMAAAATLAEGKFEDLGTLLSDPGTRLISLNSSGTSFIRDAALALNTNRQAGALFCDQLPVLQDAVRYEIWATDSSGDPAKLGSVRAEAGVSVYPFHWSAAPAQIGRLEITAGPRSDVNSPVLLGQALLGQSQ